MKDNIIQTAKLIINTRRIDVFIHIDTNRINSRGGLPFMNKLEKWHNDGVIMMEMSDVAQNEVRGTGNLKMHAKAADYLFTIALDSDVITRKKIQAILFPHGAKSIGEKNDVEIVYTAAYYDSILVTNDGNSKSQPGGILGHAKELETLLRVRVMRDSDAVSMIKEKIAYRDSQIQTECNNLNLPSPDWVGCD